MFMKLMVLRSISYGNGRIDGCGEKGVGVFGMTDCAGDSNKIPSHTTTPILETLLNLWLFSNFKGHANEEGCREHWIINLQPCI